MGDRKGVRGEDAGHRILHTVFFGIILTRRRRLHSIMASVSITKIYKHFKFYSG